MKNRSDAADAQDALQRQLAGLGEYSLRKTYYPELQQRLAELERFKAFIDHSNDIIFLLAVPTAVIVDVNDSASRQTGWSRDELLNSSIFCYSDLAASPVANRLICHPEVGDDERALAVTDLITRDQHRFPVEITLSRMQFEDGTYVIAVARDITERKRLEEQLLQSQKMEAIGRLAGGIAHDFNNILMVIMGYAHVMQRGEGIVGPQVENLRKIVSAAERAVQLTGNLLTFSRKQVMKTRAADIKEIVRHIEEFVGRIIGEDIQLRTSFAPEDLLVDVDSGQIEQVILNLATNARDAMPKGGVLTIETSRQDLFGAQSHAFDGVAPGSYACISVSDTGMGMDEATRQRIFEPFFTTKGPGKGTGLGMAIVYSILRQHKGFVNVYSEPGIGTTFKLYLPLLLFGQVAEVPDTLQVEPRGGSETILVAEDEADVRTLLEEILSGQGYRVITAINGLDAVEKYSAHRDEIALVLMDMIMPRLSGKDACRQIQQQYPDARVLYISGYTKDFIRNSDLVDDRTELIMKPVQPLELLRKVRELLDL